MKTFKTATAAKGSDTPHPQISKTLGLLYIPPLTLNKRIINALSYPPNLVLKAPKARLSPNMVPSRVEILLLENFFFEAKKSYIGCNALESRKNSVFFGANNSSTLSTEQYITNSKQRNSKCH